MNEKRNGNPELADPLAGTEFEGLPEVFSMRMDDGSYVQEREPCYRCLASTTRSRYRDVTLFEEDSIIVDPDIPNVAMEPLNRAAALAYVRWRGRLPEHRAQIDVGDMAEAAQMLATDPDWHKLNKHEGQKAVIKLAVELKVKREGLDARELPPIGHNFVRGTRTQAPPILGAKMADMSQRLPGETRFATAIPAHSQGPNVRRAGPAPMTSAR